jgi:hypothetical protein
MSAMKPLSYWPAAVMLLVAIAFIAIAFNISLGPQGADSISADDVRSIDVKLCDFGDSKGHFTAATTDHSRLLALVQHGKRETCRIKWTVLVDLDLHLRNGRTIQIMVFRTSDGPALWRIDDTYYRGSTPQEVVRHVIGDCASRGTALAN